MHIANCTTYTMIFVMISPLVQSTDLTHQIYGYSSSIYNFLLPLRVGCKLTKKLCNRFNNIVPVDPYQRIFAVCTTDNGVQTPMQIWGNVSIGTVLVQVPSHLFKRKRSSHSRSRSNYAGVSKPWCHRERYRAEILKNSKTDTTFRLAAHVDVDPLYTFKSSPGQINIRDLYAWKLDLHLIS